MHILDEAKKSFDKVCPVCGLVVKAYQLNIINADQATLFFNCYCGWRHQKRVKVKEEMRISG
jgi:hypothetical protein